MSDWYYLKNSERHGPVTGDTITTLLQAGKVAEDTMVWTGGMDSWRPLREMRSSPHQNSALDTMVQCGVCGKTGPAKLFIPTATGRLCKSCSPSETILPSATEIRYAGFWIRAVAVIVDSLILAIPAYIISMLQTAFLGSGQSVAVMLLGALYSVSANFAVGMAYEVYFLGTYSATPGKMLLNLKVRTADAEKIGYVRALGRYFAQILSAIPFGLGYIIAGFHREKRTLHDHICSTRVIHANTPYKRSKI